MSERMGSERGFARVVFAYTMLAVIVLIITVVGVSMSAAFIDARLVDVGEPISRIEAVPSVDVERVSIELVPAVSELWVEGGSQEMLTAEFTYNLPELSPTIATSITNGVQNVVITYPDSEISFAAIPRPSQFNQVRNEWRLTLDRDMPTDLDIEMGAGSAALDLSDVNLRSLVMMMGAGAVAIDLRRAWTRDTHVEVQGGLGELTLLLPDMNAVRVEIDGGIAPVSAIGLEQEENVYVNDLFGGDTPLLDIEVDAGLGAVALVASSDESR